MRRRGRKSLLQISCTNDSLEFNENVSTYSKVFNKRAVNLIIFEKNFPSTLKTFEVESIFLWAKYVSNT